MQFGVGGRGCGGGIGAADVIIDRPPSEDLVGLVVLLVLPGQDYGRECVEAAEHVGPAFEHERQPALRHARGAVEFESQKLKVHVRG